VKNGIGRKDPKLAKPQRKSLGPLFDFAETQYAIRKSAKESRRMR